MGGVGTLCAIAYNRAALFVFCRHLETSRFSYRSFSYRTKNLIYSQMMPNKKDSWQGIAHFFGFDSEFL